MPESATHLGLVQHLVLWIQENPPSAGDSVLFIDEPAKAAADKPPRIDGYAPDLYWRTLAGGSALIGEAKCAYDVESRHSRQQFAAFISHLSAFAEGILLVAVPWHVVPQAKSLIRAIQRDCCNRPVRTIFIEYLPG